MEVVKKHEYAAAESDKEATRWKGMVGKEVKHVHDLEKQREKSGIELSLANAKHTQAYLLSGEDLIYI